MQTNLFITKEKTTFKTLPLSEGYSIQTTQLPVSLRQNLDFIHLWNLHPDDFHIIKMHGKEVATPRWQQAYGMDYAYTGRVNKALPVPEILYPLLQWAQTEIDERLNGILLDWYDGDLKHYIGKHRDSTTNMVDSAPIVTISLGNERTFRLRPYQAEGKFDFNAPDGQVFVMPYITNQAFTHEVPHFGKNKGRRISVTIRAFEN
ncbi:MAG: alpha-ketoglutarate-dependent dioxygenase AlkB [Saprospiraceae bacterium]